MSRNPFSPGRTPGGRAGAYVDTTGINKGAVLPGW